MPVLRFQLFGYPALFLDKKPVKVERRKTLALAAYLALGSGGGDASQSGRRGLWLGYGRGTLATMFWSEATQQRAGAYLRQALWDLTHAIGEEWIAREGSFIQFDPQREIWVDVNEFELRLESWKAGRLTPVAAIQSLTEAVALYRADFLAGFTLRDSAAFDEWQSSQAELLRLHFKQILEALVHLNTRQRNWEAALSAARRWLDLDRLDEAAHRALMQVYYLSGQRNAALQQYQQCCELLSAELGVNPEPETVALFERLKESSSPEHVPESARPATIPTGTVTFLFTDIEGSTHLWETQPRLMEHAFKRQEAIFREVMRNYGGYVYKMIGDAFQVAFPTAISALAAAVEAQRKLQSEPWEADVEIRVRMALHTAVTEERGDDYVGSELNRVARMISVGYGGQILLSQVTADLVRGHLPEGVSLVDLGAHRLKDLEQVEHIYQVLAPGLLADFPPLKSLSEPDSDLPVMATPFIGRAQELEQVEKLLASPECRQITLLGIGGSGKTRLAIEAARLSQSFRQSAFFVPLATVQTLDEMLVAIAQAVRFKFQSQGESYLPAEVAKNLLFKYLADKRLLLILDNFEQLTGYSGLVDELLQAAPLVKVIVTSRERLNLSGEWALEVLGLPFPAGRYESQILHYPAVQLFISCAQRSSNFRVAPEDLPAISRICQLLEGVPLGIEMAAAWTRVLSCTEIVAEMEKNLDFLRTTWRGMPDRQQTLRSVFEHSWRLLSDLERQEFIRLGIFEGSFSRQAALDVAGAPILLLAALTDKSFLRRVAEGRYEIHPVLRSYVREKLKADPDLYNEVAMLFVRYYSNWLCERSEELKGARQMYALAAMRAEAHHLQVALRWLVHQQDFDLLEKALPGVVLFSTMNDQRVFMEGIASILSELQEILVARGDRPALLALVLAILRYYASFPVEADQRNEYKKQSLGLLVALPDDLLKAYALILNCIGPSPQSFRDSVNLMEKALEILTALGDRWGIALAQLVLGDIHNYGNQDSFQARAYYETSVQLFSQSENSWGLSLCYFGLMDAADREGNLEEAYRFGSQSRRLLCELNSSQRLLWTTHRLGQIALRLGKLEEARRFFAFNMDFSARQGDAEKQRVYQEMLAQLE